MRNQSGNLQKYRLKCRVQGDRGGGWRRAVNKFMKNKDKIKLLLLDVVMPGKNVKEVYDEIKKIRPILKPFMSGYGEKVVHKDSKGKLYKPVSPSELQEKVRSAGQLDWGYGIKSVEQLLYLSKKLKCKYMCRFSFYLAGVT